MNYFLLMQDDRLSDLPKILDCPASIDPQNWIKGSVVDDPGTLSFKFPPNTSDHRGQIISGIVTLFHRKLLAELKRLGVDNLQSFPAEIERNDGKIEVPYSLINVIGMIDAIDKNSSDISYVEGLKYGRLKSFKIDPVKAGGKRLFRIPEDPTLIVVDEYLRDNLVSYKAPGVMLLPTENYRNPQ
jgi:hypothetical protein